MCGTRKKRMPEEEHRPAEDHVGDRGVEVRAQVAPRDDEDVSHVLSSGPPSRPSPRRSIVARAVGVVVLVVLVLVLVVCAAPSGVSWRLRRSSPMVRLRKTSSSVCASRCSSSRTQPLSTTSWKSSGRRSTSCSLTSSNACARSSVGSSVDLLDARRPCRARPRPRPSSAARLGRGTAGRRPTPGWRRRSEPARSWRGSRRAARRPRCARARR